MAISEGLDGASCCGWPARRFRQVIMQKGCRYLLCNLQGNTENTTFITIKHRIGTAFYTGVSDHTQAFMKSRLSPEQFVSALNENTLEGNPNIKGSPFSIFTFFDSKQKYFYGNLSINKFRLTRNSGLFNLTDFIIEGNYLPSKNAETTEVQFAIKPMPFAYWWIRLMLPIALSGMSILLVTSTKSEVFSPMIIIMWVWLGFPWLFILWRSGKLKRKLEHTFKEYFKIMDD